jgi:hypothetical protein
VSENQTDEQAQAKSEGGQKGTCMRRKATAAHRRLAGGSASGNTSSGNQSHSDRSQGEPSGKVGDEGEHLKQDGTRAFFLPTSLKFSIHMRLPADMRFKENQTSEAQEAKAEGGRKGKFRTSALAFHLTLVAGGQTS